MTRPRRRLAGAVLALGFVLAGCGSDQAAAPSPSPEPPPTARPAEQAPSEIAAIRTDGTLVMLAPDGSVLRTLARDARAEYPTGLAVSPDGRWVHYVRSSTPERPMTVVRVPSGGGDIETADAGYGPAISPDGSRLAFIRLGKDGKADELVVRDLLTLGDTAWNLEELGEAAAGAFVHSVAWAPDSKTLAYVVALEFGGDLLVLDTTTQKDVSLWQGTRLRPQEDAATWNWVSYRGTGGKLAIIRGCCPPDFRDEVWGVVQMDPAPGASVDTLLPLAGPAGPLDFDVSGNHMLFVRDGVLHRWSGERDPVVVARDVVHADWH